jgi:predicted ATPase/Tfp pilus assembly protein PilF
MTKIVELVSRERLVTLTGPGGVGKTRLALEVLRADAPRRRDGAVCVELAAIREPELVASTILRTLGLPESRVTPPADALAVYVRGRQLLLLLDNFEQVLPAAPLVADLLAAAPRLAVLVTSRAALHLPGEARYEVPTLRLPEATDELALIADAESVALFMQRAAATRADFRLDADNAGVVAELCSRLDGLPLALELAGARVDLLSPAAILSRLGRRLDLLKTAEAGAPDRHSTLRAAIQWSHDLLDEDQRALFSSLAVFAGGFSADGVEAVAAGDALDGLAALIDASLIRRERPVGDEPRFAMLETIREYALERLAERRDGHDVRHRHAVFYAGLASQAEPGLRGARQTTWLKRIDADRENIRAALSWAEESGDAETGLRTAASLWRYWQVRGELAEPCRYLERLLEHAEDVEPHLRAPASFAAGRLAVMHGDREAARRFCEASFALYQELGDTASSSFALAVVAMATQALGDSRRAREVAEQAVTLARESGDWWSVSVAVSCLGDILYAEGDLSAARRCLEEAVRAAQEVGDSRNIARCENILAAIALEQNHYPRAMRLLEDALAIQRDLDDRWGIARTLTNLGIASEQAGDADAARARFEDALAIQLESDDQPGIAASLECLAALAARRGRLEQAASVYGAAAVLREMVGAQRSAEIVRRDREDAIAAVADALDDEAFADAWSAGRSMTLDEAIAYAREASAPTSTNEGSAQDVTRTLD